MDIINLIKEDIKSKKGKYIARKYYNYKPKTEEEDEINTFSNGEIHTFKKENKKDLYINHFKILVRQKLNYLLAKNPEIATNNNYTVNTIKSMLREIGLKASIDSISWLHFYVEENKLDWIFVDDKEIIPLYDKYNKKIIGIIRYYEIDKDTIRAEIWQNSGVNIKIIQKDEIKKDTTEYHYYDQYQYNDKLEDVQGRNLPFIPFIPLYNNDARQSDIIDLKDLLDMFNDVSSGFIQNIDKFQESIIKLKGFAADGEELKATMDNMKKYKMVGIPSAGNDNADIEYMAVEIPVEARQVILDLLKTSIYEVGEGLDPNKKISESNITNVVIKSRYSPLDMKSNDFETQIKIFYEKFIDSLNEFYRTSLDNEITFNRSIIFNETEQIDNCIKSLNVLPLEIVLDNHPWVSNTKEAMKLLEEEKQKNIEEQQKMFDMQQTNEKTMNTNDLNNNNK